MVDFKSPVIQHGTALAELLDTALLMLEKAIDKPVSERELREFVIGANIAIENWQHELFATATNDSIYLT